MALGTGVVGANQNGPVVAPSGTPGEILTVAGPLSINAAAPVIDTTLGDLFTAKAYDLMAYPSLRPELIFDQFATVKSVNSTHRGGSIRFSFVDDIAEQTTPLLENLDVDAVSLGGRGLSVGMREYGVVVGRTNLLVGTSMIPLDPILAERVGYNAGISMDALGRIALDATTITYDDATVGNVASIGNALADYLTATMLRNAVATMKAANVRPFAGGLYVAVISPTQAQHLMSDTNWRSQIVFDDGKAGNSVFTGSIGVFEGCRVIVNNHIGAQGKGYVLGAEALAKAFSSAPGFGPNPHVVPSPVVDGLRRFARVGWKHLVGYSLFRAEAVIHLATLGTLKP